MAKVWFTVAHLASPIEKQGFTRGWGVFRHEEGAKTKLVESFVFAAEAEHLCVALQAEEDAKGA